MKAADKAYKKMSKRYKISYVGGNSLGGGLGNYVASNNDVPSVTYNPAILPDCEYSNKNPDITNYMSEYDPLTLGERSAGYTERLPGKNVILKNNIPLFATIASNHTGYDDPIKIDGEEVLIDADAYLPVGVWSGAILTGGKGHKIDVNPENMKILANSMVSRMKGQITTAQSHVDHAVDIVEREGNKLDDRTTKLKDGFDDLIGQGVFGKALTTMSGYEFLRDIIESGNPAISKATEAINRIKNSSAFSDFLLSFLGNFNGMVGVGIKLPILIIDTVTRLDDIVTQVNALKKELSRCYFRE
ncbi:hypothetical protein AAHO55_10770 [Listeria aquatica]